MRMRLPTSTMLALLTTSALALTGPATSHATSRVPPAAHRALYDLNLESSRGGDVTAARGTMAYEVTDACDGWATRQRLAMTITNRDGQDIETVSDYATWESKDGLSMRFRMQQTTDTAVTEQAEGDGQARQPRRRRHHPLHAAGRQRRCRCRRARCSRWRIPTPSSKPPRPARSSSRLPIFDGTGDKGAQDSSVSIINWRPTPAPPYPALAHADCGRVRIAFFDRVPRPAPRQAGRQPGLRGRR